MGDDTQIINGRKRNKIPSETNLVTPPITNVNKTMTSTISHLVLTYFNLHHVQIIDLNASTD